MGSFSFERAQEFIWNNARLIERRLFAYLFCGGSRQAVVIALKAYQNLDGGFGNALEADVRSPDSQPVAVEQALRILDQVGAIEDPSLKEYVRTDILFPLCDFCQQVSTPELGMPNSLPSANLYPHQPWWETAANSPAALNPTASIVGFLMRFRVRHPWVEKAAGYCWSAIEATETDQYHDLMPIITFLINAADRPRAERELGRVVQRIHKPGVVAYDPHAQGYVKKPLDWAPAPGSFCRKLFDDATIEQHLEALAGSQQPDGGWPISWEALSPAAEAEWRGVATVEALAILRAYGKI